ncbi:MAG: ABC transporter permease subunit [Clostridia bacterium]|nr:ABC transporter permease subunit [Clostridia bacterium]
MHRKKKLSSRSKHISALLSVVFLYVLWYAASLIIDKTMAYNLVLPSPNLVFIKVFELLSKPTTFSIIFSSFSRLLAAVAASFFSALILGTIAGLNEAFDAFLKPYISSIRAIPVASMLIVVLLWIGSKNAPLVICAMVVFPIFYEMVSGSIKNIEKSYLEVISLDSKLNFFAFRKVIIPAIFSNLFISFIQSVGLGFKVLVMSELIAYTENSIGKKIYTSKLNLDIEGVYAWTIIIIIIVMLLEWMLRYAKKRYGTEN